MTFQLAERPVLLGDQRPRVSSVPPYVSSSGLEAIENAELAGLFLDDWQAYELTEALGEADDGRWASMEVADVVGRQNGKGGLIEARELAGLFLFGEELLIHSAHEFSTSFEAFLRMEMLIDNCREFKRRVARVNRTPAYLGFTLNTRGKRHGRPGAYQRLQYRTRTGSGARGFTADLVILDEAMMLTEAMMGSLAPTLSTIPNPQIWYMGSAVDEEAPKQDGVPFARVRERGLAGGDPSLAYFEHSVDPDLYYADLELYRNGQRDHPARDPWRWAQANPALGVRITAEHIEKEQRGLMDERRFATERLGVGHWPATTPDDGWVIPRRVWLACADAGSGVDGVGMFALDMTPDRDRSSIAVAGRRSDGKWHGEVVENQAGTDWIVAAVAALQRAHPKAQFFMDPHGPAATLIEVLRRDRVNIVLLKADEYVQACGGFYDLVMLGDFRTTDSQPELDAALGAAVKRDAGDSWKWARKSLTDISPLVAVTLAVWGAQRQKQPSRFVSLADALAGAQ